MQIVKLEKGKLSAGALATTVAVATLGASMLLMPLSAKAAHPTLPAFTDAEIATWETDRSVPSGGFDSVSFAGRDDVFMLSVDKDNRADTDNTFYYTEGLKKTADLGTEISADLYVDSDWSEKSVRAGLWGVGADSEGDISLYPIVEFSTEREGGSTGWRIWNVDQWQNLDVGYDWDEWSNLRMIIAENEMQFLVDNEQVATSSLEGTVEFDEVIFNSYNYGAESESYDVHWHAGVEAPVEEDDTTRPTAEFVSPNGEEYTDTVAVELAMSDDESGLDNMVVNIYGSNEDGGIGSLIGTCGRATELDGAESHTVECEIDVSDYEAGTYHLKGGGFDVAGNNRTITTTFEVAADEPEEPTDPTDKNQCKAGGWEDFGFKNQGQCIRFVETGQDSR